MACCQPDPPHGGAAGLEVTVCQNQEQHEGGTPTRIESCLLEETAHLRGLLAQVPDQEVRILDLTMQARSEKRTHGPGRKNGIAVGIVGCHDRALGVFGLEVSQPDARHWTRSSSDWVRARRADIIVLARSFLASLGPRAVQSRGASRPREATQARPRPARLPAVATLWPGTRLRRHSCVSRWGGRGDTPRERKKAWRDGG